MKNNVSNVIRPNHSRSSISTPKWLTGTSISARNAPSKMSLKEQSEEPVIVAKSFGRGLPRLSAEVVGESIAVGSASTKLCLRSLLRSLTRNLRMKRCRMKVSTAGLSGLKDSQITVNTAKCLIRERLTTGRMLTENTREESRTGNDYAGHVISHTTERLKNARLPLCARMAILAPETTSSEVPF